MKLTETIKLQLNNEQRKIVVSAMEQYIASVNEFVALADSGVSIAKFSSKDVDADLPSAVKAQVTRDARSIIRKHYKECHKAVMENRKLEKSGSDKRVRAPKIPVIKCRCCYWNNQNFCISKDVFKADDRNVYLSFPVMVNGKCTRIRVRTSMTKRQYELLQNKHLGTMRIVFKNGKLVSQITYEEEEPLSLGNNTMGVDLGIKVPAVSYTADGKVKFYGNGRKNKYMRRHFAYLRKKLQNKKKIKAVKRINDKEQCIMKDLDHKVSRAIVNEALKRNVDTIKLEQLQNIRSSTRTSRKNNHSLHTWSFYRLAQFIEYKAALAGINVVYVNPAYTSQRCPVCGNIHHADDRTYSCRCGYKSNVSNILIALLADNYRFRNFLFAINGFPGN